METKWLMVAWATIMVAMFAGMGIEHYSDSQCRIEAIKSNVPSDQVARACGIKK